MLLLSILKAPFYEFFSKSHYLMAVLAAYMIWRHLSIRSLFSRLYIVIAISILVFTTILRYLRIIFRSATWKKPYATTKLVAINDVIRAQIEVPRPWKIRAGDFVYICMPGVSPWSPFQSHPFMISWWDQDAHDRGATIYLLIKPKSGFTQRLLRHLQTSGLKTWIDGPYGSAKNIGDYGRVMMFASGIGIAAQVPYIKELLKGVGDYKVRTRRILLIWQLDKESKRFPNLWS